MKFLGILFVFFGYMLVYASAAAGGKFATEPWAGLFADAYTGAQPTTSEIVAAGGTPPATSAATVVPRAIFTRQTRARLGNASTPGAS